VSNQIIDPHKLNHIDEELWEMAKEANELKLPDDLCEDLIIAMLRVRKAHRKVLDMWYQKV
jgi:hypothetical protein